MRLVHRITIALPDAAAAALFLWVWLNPLAWHRLMVGVLVLALMLEFIAIQAGPFIGNVLYGDKMGFDRRERRRDAIILGIAYLVFAALAAASFDSWMPFFLCLWLFGVKVFTAIFGRDPEATGREREMRLWVRSGSYFFGAIFIAMVAPVPMFGITEDGSHYGLPGKHEWANYPYEAIAAGFLYFLALSLTRFFDLPRQKNTP